jgi:hypothetical protein
MVADTKTLLADWDTAVPAQLNLDRIRRENVLGTCARRAVDAPGRLGKPVGRTFSF